MRKDLKEGRRGAKWLFRQRQGDCEGPKVGNATEQGSKGICRASGRGPEGEHEELSSER